MRPLLFYSLLPPSCPMLMRPLPLFSRILSPRTSTTFTLILVVASLLTLTLQFLFSLILTQGLSFFLLIPFFFPHFVYINYTLIYQLSTINYQHFHDNNTIRLPSPIFYFFLFQARYDTFHLPSARLFTLHASCFMVLHYLFLFFSTQSRYNTCTLHKPHFRLCFSFPVSRFSGFAFFPLPPCQGKILG